MPAPRSAAGPAEPDTPPPAGFVAAACGVGLVLTALLTLWGVFLVPFRVLGVLVPVSWVLAGLGNALLTLAGGRLLGRVGAAAPGLVWLALVLVLQPRRTEGDLALPGTPVGLGYVLVGALAAVAAYAVVSARLRAAPPQDVRPGAAHPGPDRRR